MKREGKRLWFGVFGAVVLLGAALLAPAYADGDLLSKAVNDPSRVWGVFGKLAKAELIKDAAVSGGTAERVAVSAKGGNPWDAGASTAIVKPVQKDDVLLLAFWAKAVTPPEGGAVEIVARIQENKAPYAAVGTQETVRLTDAWKMYYVKGMAAQDYPKGAISAALNIATGAQVFDLGPIMIIDFGSGYDVGKLPTNR